MSKQALNPLMAFISLVPCEVLPVAINLELYVKAILFRSLGMAYLLHRHVGSLLLLSHFIKAWKSSPLGLVFLGLSRDQDRDPTSDSAVPLNADLWEMGDAAKKKKIRVQLYQSAKWQAVVYRFEQENC